MLLWPCLLSCRGREQKALPRRDATLQAWPTLLRKRTDTHGALLAPERVHLGQVTGVDVDKLGRVWVFHRSQRTWAAGLRRRNRSFAMGALRTSSPFRRQKPAKQAFGSAFSSQGCRTTACLKKKAARFHSPIFHHVMGREKKERDCFLFSFGKRAMIRLASPPLRGAGGTQIPTAR